jgi:hypothetical protein
MRPHSLALCTAHDAGTLRLTREQKQKNMHTQQILTPLLRCPAVRRAPRATRAAALGAVVAAAAVPKKKILILGELD